MVWAGWPLGLVAVLMAALGAVACSPAPSAAPTLAPPGITSPSVTAAHTVSSSGAVSGVSPSGSGGVVVVPFEEADAVRLTPGQDADVTFPALPGLRIPGRVLAIGPSAVTISGVTNFYVTVALTGGDPRLRAGLTAVVTAPVA
jgi:HlyD family secretion protein